MLLHIYKEIEKGNNLRDNLIKLKEIIKDSTSLSSFRYMLGGDYSVLLSLLDNEDPKVRKNVAAILGELKDSTVVNPLFEAYLKEGTRFVKSTYLKSIYKLNYTSLVSKLTDIRNEINSKTYVDDELKHIREEISILNKMLDNNSGLKHHSFNNFNKKYDIVLTTNKHFVKELAKEFEDCNVRCLKSGIRFVCEDLHRAMKVRIYNELLFCVNSLKSVSGEAAVTAADIMDSDMTDIITSAFGETYPFKFRVETRGIKDKDKERKFTKKVSGEIERISKGRLINSTGDYEVEIRLVKNKEDRFIVFLRFMNLNDARFQYRRNVLPVSIHPVNAAIMMKVAKDYFREDARVLDPFCGVGTLLIERKKLMNAATLYGTDTFGKAIDMARENTSYANIVVNYINRDFFDFKHEYPFDEIVTDMPCISDKHSKAEIEDTYNQFFIKCREILSAHAIIVMYSNERRLVKSIAERLEEYEILEEYTVSEKDGRYIFVIRKNK